MKKILIVFVILLLMTGCTKTLKCTLDKEEGNTDYDTVIEIDYSKDTVKKVDYIMSFDSLEEAKKVCENFNKIKGDNEEKFDCNAKVLVIKDYHKTLNKNMLNKDVIKSYYESYGYTCK